MSSMGYKRVGVIRSLCRQSAPHSESTTTTMKVLVVLSLAAVACGSTQLLRYPNVYGASQGCMLDPNLGGYISNGLYSNFLRYGYPQARPIIEDADNQSS
ncbi:hypothetical protein Pcinc_030843 [Petrolisthes cinctipes]|uniref:Uncharacterized protein n=1 Tax=Petrolisthes cinctipes TaxID=88211 RepID=A0AAE1K5G2_PETCI|nr:hypothetical protein Pcinc_030843 [Petrolisthes cinctipes]